MAIIRLFAVRLAATRPCVAAPATGSFSTRPLFADLPPIVRRAFTQSSCSRYPYVVKKSTDADTIAAEPGKTPTPTPTPTSPKHGKKKKVTKATKASKTRPLSSTPAPETVVKIEAQAPPASPPPATPPPVSSPEPPPIEATPDEKLLPETLLIYSPGQARIIYVAFWKVTSLLLGVTCSASLVPASIAGTIGLSSIAVVCSSWIPFAVMNYISRPFVTYMFLRLPPTARTSRENLERYIRYSPPADARLRIMTLGLVVKPRVTDVTLAELKPAKGNFGLVDYARDVTAANARRKWYEYFPIAKFGIADDSNVKEAWAWHKIRSLLGKSAEERLRPWKPLE